MSYEGYDVALCCRGHQHVKDAYFTWEEGTSCDRNGCEHLLVWFRSVDETNGEDPNDPWTMPPKLEEIGFEDLAREDHHGNKYFIKEYLYSVSEQEKEGRWLETKLRKLCPGCKKASSNANF